LCGIKAKFEELPVDFDESSMFGEIFREKLIEIVMQ